MIEDTCVDVRRFDALLGDYDAEPAFAENLDSEDEAKYQEMQVMHKAMVIGYCDYVRQCLKEHLGNPTSNNVLSESVCESILARLDRELALLNAHADEDRNTDETDGKETEYPAMIRKNKAIA